MSVQEHPSFSSGTCRQYNTQASSRNYRSPASRPRLGPVEMPVRRCGGNESWKVKVEMASSKSKSYGDSYSRIAQAIHILVPLHHLNWSFIHWCQFLLTTMLHLVAATGDDRLKSPQPLLLTPEQTRPKLAICGILEKQLRFSVLTQPL